MKTFERAKDVLDNVQGFHDQVGQLYHELSDRAENERVKMLLGFMSDHEQKFCQSLASYEETMPRAVRDTWFQYTQEETTETFLKKLDLQPKLSIDDVTDLGMRVDSYLESLFQELSSIADSEGAIEVQEVFRNLLEMEQEAKRTLSKTIDSIWDM